jgi:integration host factor subunit beta|tara:strand:- start:179 stop:466 length:288 start_codon:yes stop_codon:yes gene_type:complete
MQKSDLLEKLNTQNIIFTSSDSKIALDSLIDHLTNLLSEKQRIEIRGFGAFSVRERNPIRGRNPKSGKAIELDSRSLIYFRPSKLIKNRINKLTS